MVPTTFRSFTTAEIQTSIRAGKNLQLVGPIGSGKSFYLRFLTLSLPNFQYIDLDLIPEKNSNSIISYLQPFFQFPNSDSKVIAFDSFETLASPALADLHNWLFSQYNLHRYQLSYIFASNLPIISLKKLETFHHLDQLISQKIVYLPPLSYDDAIWFIDDCMARIDKKLTLNQKENYFKLSGGYMQTLKRLVEAEEDFQHDIHLNYHLEKLYRNLKPVLSDKTLLTKMGFLDPQGGFSNLILGDFIRRQITPPPLPLSDLLTSGELKVYRYLMDHPNLLCSREDLIGVVWGSSLHPEASDHALDQLVHRLKNKISKHSPTIKIETIRGRGHRLSKIPS
jgi:hypothetical protein